MGCGLQHALEWFETVYEMGRMKISTSKSEFMVLTRNSVDCPVLAGDELPQEEEFKFTNEGRRKREIDRGISALPVMRMLYCSVGKKSWKAKLSNYWSIYVPTHTYGHALWVMTERIFLHKVSEHSLRNRIRSLDIQEELKIEPLLRHIKRNQLM